MTACSRFEEEGLLLLDEGRALPEHFATCPDCLAARAAHDALRARLAAAATLDQPPAGWQGEVWAAIARRGPRHAWLNWAWLPAALAAAAVVVVVLRPPIAIERPGALTVEVKPGPGAFRGQGEARPGDDLVFRADVDAAVHAELRLYRDDHLLILSCSVEAPCVRRGEVLRARVRLDGAGTYQPLLLLSARPLPPPAGGVEADAREARQGHARVLLGEPILVR
jgi:hypothetical protein